MHRELFDCEGVARWYWYVNFSDCGVELGELERNAPIPYGIIMHLELVLKGRLCMRLLVAGLTLLVGLSSISTASIAASSADLLHVQQCVQGKTKVSAECGTLRVYENRSTAMGRTILIHFIVLKAKHPNGHVIYVNLGGPGEELSEVPFLANGGGLKELQALRDRYDILFVDERGFGLSHPITCQLTPPAHPELYFSALWPAKLLAACRGRSAKTSDLAQYNTKNAIADLEDLRGALRYKKLIFDVGSYGTYTALQYMRRYPSSVGSSVFMGVDPPGLANLTLAFAKGSQMSFDQLSADCSRDTTCRTTFPDFRAHFYAILHRLDSGPIPIKVKNAVTSKIQTVMLSREVFADAVRHLLYDPEGASYLPYIITHAYDGDTLPLGTLVDLLAQSFAQGIQQGAFLSYTCSEDMPFGNSPADLQHAKSISWFGDDRIAAQLNACKIWNVPALPAGFNNPVRTAAPILMFSGTVDPATPAYQGTDALKYLSNARQMLIKNAPHDAESACTDRIAVQFIRSGGSWKGIALNACTGNFKRPPFATTWPPH